MAGANSVIRQGIEGSARSDGWEFPIFHPAPSKPGGSTVANGAIPLA